MKMQHQYKQLQHKRSETAKGLDAKLLSFHNNSYKGQQYTASCLCLCVCLCLRERGRWQWELFIKHSSSQRRHRPHINADLTLSDRTSPFSAIIPSSYHHTIIPLPWWNSSVLLCDLLTEVWRHSSWCCFLMARRSVLDDVMQVLLMLALFSSRFPVKYLRSVQCPWPRHWSNCDYKGFVPDWTPDGRETKSQTMCNWTLKKSWAFCVNSAELFVKMCSTI